MPAFEVSNLAPLWWGQLFMAFIEGALFCILIAMYFYVRPERRCVAARRSGAASAGNAKPGFGSAGAERGGVLCGESGG